jgi:hypothetical protein
LLWFCLLNPGSAVTHADEMAHLLKDSELHFIYVCETWFKRWKKRIGLTGYKVVCADRRDGRRGKGVVMYIKNKLKYKVLVKSENSYTIDYLFVKLKYHGENVLIGLIYNSPGVAGLQIFQPILGDLYPRYTHCRQLGDLNTNLLAKTARTMILKLQLKSVLLSIASSEPTNFTAAEST